ncbi:MAG: hypothetical protein ACO3LC_05650 [Ilumatobacteraceae bacterium]
MKPTTTSAANTRTTSAQGPDSEKGDADEDEAREADPLARGSGEIPHPRHDRSGHED